MSTFKDLVSAYSSLTQKDVDERALQMINERIGTATQLMTQLRILKNNLLAKKADIENRIAFAKSHTFYE